MSRTSRAAIFLGMALCTVALPCDARSQRPRELPEALETPAVRLATMRVRSILRVDEPDLVLGVEDAEGPTLFGMITSIATGPGGEILIADYSDNSIRVFAADGRHLQTIGRRGRAPGEFMNPVTLRGDGGQRMLALQRTFGLTEFAFVDSRLAVKSADHAGKPYVDVCFVEGALVASGWVGGQMLHSSGNAGVPDQSWGAGWSEDSVAAVRAADNSDGGGLVCDSRNRDVFLFNGATGVVRAYDHAGSLRWELRLPSFRFSSRFVQRDPDGRSALVIRYGEDHIASVWMLDSARLMVQVRRVSFGSLGRLQRGGATVPPVTSETSYLVDRTTGRLLGRLTDLPAFDVVQGRFGYRKEQEPFPRVIRQRITLR